MAAHKLTYSEFNLKCFEYYCSNNATDGYGSFLIPPSEIVDWLGLDYNNPQIQFAEINNQEWTYFLNEDFDTSIPRCFGIVAVQCYGAFLRQNTTKTTDRQLNRAIENLIGYETSQLQKEFGNGYPNTQDKLWGKAQTHLENNSVKILLPAPSKGPGRNVQYPKSQVFFTLETFKSLHPLLIKAEESFIADFQEFKDFILEKFRTNKSNIRNYNNILSNTLDSVNKRGVFVNQLYNYWHSSDWKNAYFKILKEKNYKKELKQGKDADFLIYYNFEDNEIAFYSMINENQIDINETNISNLLNLGPILFSSLSETPYDFFQEKNFSLGVPYFIITEKYSSFIEKITHFENISWFEIGNICYAYLSEGFHNPKSAVLFSDYSKTIVFNPIQLNGIKLDFRKNIYLHNSQLEVSFDTKYLNVEDLEFFKMIEGSRSEQINLPQWNDNKIIFDYLAPGDYAILLKNFNDIKFSIAEVSFTNNYNFVECSFNTNTCTIENNSNGIYSTNYPYVKMNSKLSHKNVIDIIIFKKNISTTNYILKALNKVNHGN